ncbi:hypothetical protein [Tautonia plasticadhaerens]|uniref:Uncharacterized protein n=1 Tax=Tautonia plasticadhaerens TaxID=2527974 RepID=A0A518HEF6_9BACT|nr:hypothetical protein [Tautonia plasticadhaerens]QDV39231.1 hypothetical protein ElP_71950 [Tautonia plasticadhaerens]
MDHGWLKPGAHAATATHRSGLEAIVPAPSRTDEAGAMTDEDRHAEGPEEDGAAQADVPVPEAEPVPGQMSVEEFRQALAAL